MHLRPLCFCALTLLLGCKSAPLQPGSGPVDVTAAPPLRISFRPPDGKQLEERSVTTRNAEGKTERVEATMTSRYDHQASGGWLLSQWVPLVKVTRDGVPFENPLVELVTRFPVKLELAADGAFVKLANPEDAEAAVRSTFPNPEEAAQWLAFFSPEALEEQSRREWESKYAGLFDRNLGPGAKLYAVETVATEGGPSAFIVERTLTARSQSGFGETAVFSLRCSGKSEEFSANEQVQRLLQQRGAPPLEPSAACEGQQIVALSPFVPVRSWIRLTFRPGGQGAEVTLNRDVTALKLE